MAFAHRLYWKITQSFKTGLKNHKYFSYPRQLYFLNGDYLNLGWLLKGFINPQLLGRREYKLLLSLLFTSGVSWSHCWAAQLVPLSWLLPLPPNWLLSVWFTLMKCNKLCSCASSFVLRTSYHCIEIIELSTIVQFINLFYI